MAVVNITSYIDGLEPTTRDKLYESPWTCQAVLRSLQPLAKQYIIRLLWIDRPVASADVQGWIRDRKAHEGQHFSALGSLEALGVFEQLQTEEGHLGYRLHPTFQKQLRWSLAGGGQVVHEPPAEVLSAAPTMEELDGYAHKQWEGLQLYLLTSSSLPPQLPADVACTNLDLHRLLVSAGLLSGERHSRSITEHGFQFLLKDNYRQLWTFLAEYIRDAEQRSGSELSSVMSFLMQLGFRRVGQPCLFEELCPMERTIAGHMMQLGLLRPFRQATAALAAARGSVRTGSVSALPLYFCPTRLASSLCGGFKPSAISANADIAGGHIIVETNYRVYAYTSSPVQVAILELFCRNDCVLPNLFVGTLTRESVLKAVGSGISADEIVSYLRTHAHPTIAARSPVVPEVVMDQIRLWEAETMRVRYSSGLLYENFETQELFNDSLMFAVNHGLILWSCRDSKKFVAKESGHEQLRQFIKDWKEEADRKAQEKERNAR